MAFTTTQLQALQDAIASGTLRVKYDGIEKWFPSMDDLKAAYQLVKSELEASGAVTPAKRTSYTAFEKD